MAIGSVVGIIIRRRRGSGIIIVKA
jgi:hypothetical protein